MSFLLFAFTLALGSGPRRTTTKKGFCRTILDCDTLLNINLRLVDDEG